MGRTTIALEDKLQKKLTVLARQENRSMPNLIETILLHYLDDSMYVDEFEMEGINHDRSLRESIRKGLADYRAGRGRIV